MKKQYGNSFWFRMLKWLHPLLMTVLFAVYWNLFYCQRYAHNVSAEWFAALIVVYFLLIYVLEKTYHALTVGLLRVFELVYSQGLACLFSAIFMYMGGCLYYNRLMQPMPMLIMLFSQVTVSLIWSMMANRLYFQHYSVPSAVIVYKDERDLARINAIRYFTEHFDVQKVIHNPDEEDAAALLAELKGYQVVFVAGIDASLRNEIAKFCVKEDVKGYFVPHLGDVIMAGADHMATFGEPIMKVQRKQMKTEYLAFKRLLDVVISAIGIVVAAPFMLAISIAIKMCDGGPVLYKQKRLTQNGKVFSILKFRSMRVDAESDGVARLASENDNRITPVGKFIRAVRFDELPQLFNILVGDMSVVGPRPERPEIVAEYADTLPDFHLRLQLKAGLTGLAQVYGRYNTEPYSKLQMDLMYINKVSLQMDLRLIFATVKILFMKESTEGVQDPKESKASAEEKANKKTA